MSPEKGKHLLKGGRKKGFIITSSFHSLQASGCCPGVPAQLPATSQQQGQLRNTHYMTLLQPLGLSTESQPGSPYSSTHSASLLPLGLLSPGESSNTLQVQTWMNTVLSP